MFHLYPDAIEAPEEDYLYLQDSQLPDAGKGLFSAIKIYSNEIIAVYLGELLDEKEAAHRAEHGRDGYFIVLTEGGILDSHNVECMAKYANDCEAFGKHDKFKTNAVIMHNEAGEPCLVAKRTIKEGEEIFCAYGKDYWKKRQHLNKNIEE